MDWKDANFWDGLDEILGTHKFDAVIFDNDCYKNFIYYYVDYQIEMFSTLNTGIKATIWYSLTIIKKHITTDGILLIFGQSEEYPNTLIYNYLKIPLDLIHIGNFKLLNSNIINIFSPTTNKIINTSNIFGPGDLLKFKPSVVETNITDFIKNRLLKI